MMHNDEGNKAWLPCVVVTVNPNAKKVQYNERTGKAEHFGSYLIRIGDPGKLSNFQGIKGKLMESVDESSLRKPQ